MDKGQGRFAFICITLLFFAWGFITCMNDLLIPKFKVDFDLTQFEANLIQSAFFGAFFIVSGIYYLFSTYKGDPINRVGYKNGLVLGLAVCGIGCFLFYPAAITHQYFLFLLALLTLGAGVTIIQIAANPYVSILGKEEEATSRLNLSQGINSLGYVLAPVVGGFLLFGDGLYDGQSGHEAVKLTYLFLGICFFAIAIIIKSLKLPEFKQEEVRNSKISFKENKKFFLGLVAIFFYVGSEVSVGSILINYLGDPAIVGLPVHLADKYLSFYWGGLMIGRLAGAIALSSMEAHKKYTGMLIVAILATFVIVGTASFKNYMTVGEMISFSEIIPFFGIILLSFLFFFLGRKSAGHMIGLFALVAASLTLSSMFSKGNFALWSIIGIGLFNSIMWSNIFTLSIQGMKDKTSKASSLLVMMIVGGAIMPAIQGACADVFGLRSSLVVVLIGYTYLVYFGFLNAKVKVHA